jgi:crossover junction endodeoxyribonuclease RuvC
VSGPSGGAGGGEPGGGATPQAKHGRAHRAPSDCGDASAPLAVRAAPPIEQVVLGVDPGTAVTGYGVVLRRGGGVVTLLECGIIRTSAHTPLPARIREIYEGICELLGRFDPFAVAVEDVFQGKNVRSALTLGHARGAILLAASLQERVIAEYTPAEIKSAVAGTGRATKEQVAFMVQQQLRLKQAPSPADAADGVAAALCHCLVGGAPRLGRRDGDGSLRLPAGRPGGRPADPAPRATLAAPTGPGDGAASRPGEDTPDRAGDPASRRPGDPTGRPSAAALARHGIGPGRRSRP